MHTDLFDAHRMLVVARPMRGPVSVGVAMAIGVICRAHRSCTQALTKYASRPPTPGEINALYAMLRPCLLTGLLCDADL